MNANSTRLRRSMLCGIDEAGRGPLAGPVFAAAVILNPKRRILGLADSKQLSAAQRECLAASIKQYALAWSVASASVEEIDFLNILQASLLAMRRAVESLSMAPRQVVVDGLHCPLVAFPVRAIVRGDSSVTAISAASIIAKTERDAEMTRLDRDYPQYGFARHKGYSTPEHLALLRYHGASAIHRRSFAPVRILLDN